MISSTHTIAPATPELQLKAPLPDNPRMDCRPRCGACCTAPSISTPIPGMPAGKPAGVRCLQLSADEGCRLFDDPRRPRVCRSLAPSAEMCGHTRQHAMRWLSRLEFDTNPL